MIRDSIGSYRIVRKLGEGGMGVVYEAVHDTIARRVAIKTLHVQFAHDAEKTSRFFNEARAVNRIGHPGIVRISEFAHEPSGAAYIVMEYLDGEPLRKRLDRLKRLPWRVAARLGMQLAEALAAAHEKGIVHRDLKPENVIIVADSQAMEGERTKLLDFGIAKLVGDTANPKARAKAGESFGSPIYMSPEQCASAGRIDAKSDVYSLGCVLYEMLAGRPPFEGKESAHLMTQHLTSEPADLLDLVADVPPSFARLIHRMLRKERRARPSMKQAVKALKALALGHSGAAGLLYRLPSLGRSRQRVAAVGAALGLSALVIGGTIAVHRHRHPPLKTPPTPTAPVETAPAPPAASPPAPPPAPQIESPPSVPVEKKSKPGRSGERRRGSHRKSAS